MSFCSRTIHPFVSITSRLSRLSQLIRVTSEAVHAPAISSHHIYASFLLLLTTSDSLISSTSISAGSNITISISISAASVLLGWRSRVMSARRSPAFRGSRQITGRRSLSNRTISIVVTAVRASARSSRVSTCVNCTRLVRSARE